MILVPGKDFRKALSRMFAIFEVVVHFYNLLLGNVFRLFKIQKSFKLAIHGNRETADFVCNMRTHFCFLYVFTWQTKETHVQLMPSLPLVTKKTEV